MPDTTNMNLLINCSNLKVGGGIQVAHSFINELKFVTDHITIVVSSQLLSQLVVNDFPVNVSFVEYNIKPTIQSFIYGNNSFLDSLVKKTKPECVFTVFGPSYWKPKVKHICGYAKPHYVYKDSPFFRIISAKERILLWIKEKIHIRDFRNNTDLLISENEDVSAILRRRFPKKEVITVSNNYHQIFDNSSQWDNSILVQEANLCYLLTISANYPHKNLSIIPAVARVLEKRGYKNFRFVLTLERHELDVPKGLEKYIIYIGKVPIRQCPHLYEQCDFMFLPTLLECFSASYPEAMKMQTPILTSNLSFAKGICKNAALYFNPMDPDDIAERIIQIYNDKELQKELVNAGIKRVVEFPTAAIRAKRYIELMKS